MANTWNIQHLKNTTIVCWISVVYQELHFTHCDIPLRPMPWKKEWIKKVLSEILGHSSVAFTLDTYAHVLNSFKRENMDLMNDIYQKQIKAQNIVLSFKPFKKQYIVSIPENKNYTFIADSIQEGIEYVESRKSDIILSKTVDIQKAVSSKAANEIIIFIS